MKRFRVEKRGSLTQLGFTEKQARVIVANFTQACSPKLVGVVGIVMNAWDDVIKASDNRDKDAAERVRQAIRETRVYFNEG